MKLTYNSLAIKAITFLFLLIGGTIFAHGNLTIRIKEKTEAISKNPNNSKLYFQRGFLYQQHLEFNKAITDYKKAESLGFDDKILYYRRAEVFNSTKNSKEALKAIESYFKIDSKDIKIYKLKSHILIQDKQFDEALKSYDYVIANTIDLRPEDFIEHANIILSINNTNYNDAIASINLGLDKLGKNTLTLQLKKLEYLKGSGQVIKVITQYNYFITKEKRKEVWYYKKANYLYEIGKLHESKISLQQAKLSIDMLSPRFQQTSTIKKLIQAIKQLEKTLNQ